MRTRLERSYRFEAAHFLPKVPAGHKCARMHGHSYLIEVVIEGEVDPDRGWVMDFADIDEHVMPLVKTLDHHVLNEIDGLANPTSELLAIWCWQRIAPSLPALVDRIVDLIVAREKRHKHYGTVVLAEGLAEMLPESAIANLPLDEHGHLPLGRFDLGKLVAQLVGKRYEERYGRKKKLTGLQLGYESRCAPPHAFDVMLGSQLGIGAYRALVEENLDGHMVSVSGQLDLNYVPFKELINPTSMKTEVRFIKAGSDYHKLARFLETRTDRALEWTPARREER